MKNIKNLLLVSILSLGLFSCEKDEVENENLNNSTNTEAQFNEFTTTPENDPSDIQGAWKKHRYYEYLHDEIVVEQFYPDSLMNEWGTAMEFKRIYRFYETLSSLDYINYEGNTTFRKIETNEILNYTRLGTIEIDNFTLRTDFDYYKSDVHPAGPEVIHEWGNIYDYEPIDLAFEDEVLAPVSTYYLIRGNHLYRYQLIPELARIHVLEFIRV